jgi:hypothetical protein
MTRTNRVFKRQSWPMTVGELDVEEVRARQSEVMGRDEIEFYLCQTKLESPW